MSFQIRCRKNDSHSLNSPRYRSQQECMERDGIKKKKKKRNLKWYVQFIPCDMCWCVALNVPGHWKGSCSHVFLCFFVLSTQLGSHSIACVGIIVCARLIAELRFWVPVNWDSGSAHIWVQRVSPRPEVCFMQETFDTSSRTVHTHSCNLCYR